MENGVALAAIALAGTAVASLAWVIRYFATTFVDAMKSHTAAAVELKAESAASRETSEEVLKFMKNLNGKLEGAFVAKVKEKSRNRS